MRTTEDDESTIDRLLAEPVADWRDEWDRTAQGFRTSQGCFTSGQWTMANDLRVGAPMGKHARFATEYQQLATDVTSYENLDLWFLFPQRFGTLGAMFRPYYDKSRQDFAVRWEFGADSTASQLRLTYGLEDLFNNLWVWRQTRVGEQGEPYDRHPWEPDVKAALRREGWRVEAQGRWLSPGRKRVGLYGAPTGAWVQTLWGTWGRVALEARVAGVTCFARGEQRQARSTNVSLVDASAGDGLNSRRLSQGELGLRRRFGRVTAEARWVYADGYQGFRPPTQDGLYHGVDRVVQGELRWAARRSLTVRAGGLYDRISVVETRWVGSSSWRNESRAYVGLLGRIGRVSLSGTEGIELDPEKYPVWHHHDKGFLALQTTF